MQLTADLSQLHPEVRRRIVKNVQHEDAAQYALGAVEQAKLKKFYDALAVPGFSKQDIGPLHFVISDDQAARARAAYGELCFMDPDFVTFLKRHHEDMRVREVGTKIQSGYRGPVKTDFGSSKLQVPNSKRSPLAKPVQTHG
jgi:hypothetical protein